MAHETNIDAGTISKNPNTRPIMKNTLVVSFLLHLVILIGLQKTVTIDWIKKPLKTYHVELIRPPMDPLENESIEKKAEFGKIKPEENSTTQTAEDTISLDTKDKRYVSYVNMIKARLMQHWDDYPDEAWENLIEGDVRVLFRLNRQGQLLGIKTLQPSPHPVFNAETTRTIRSSAPFPPFPSSIKVSILNIKADFVYRLTASK